MKFVLSTSFSSVAHLRVIAPVADETGWEAMSFSDHVVHPESISTPYPYTEDGSRRWPAFTDWPDPWVTIGALAAITTRLRFTNNVFVLPMRNPFLVAKAISTAAVLSDNRVTPAFGVGWSSDEFALMGQDFHTRGRRGISDPAMRRAARLADGWVTDLQTTAEILDCIAKIRSWRLEYERDGDFAIMATPSDAWDIDGYRRLEDAGVTHIMTMPWAFYHGDTDSLDEKLDGVRRFADDVIAKMQ
jgi:alkanesulfonate monooxygenase SsuD/methylene tetrahydromethanopterin reductase-like flavin-dependent oxidoreductase (luciferase family)